MTADPPATSPTWAPLRLTVFRWLWIASLVSNVGTWMQTVGARWFLIHAAHAAILVSLVQNTGSAAATAVDVDVVAMGHLPGQAEAQEAGPAVAPATAIQLTINPPG